MDPFDRKAREIVDRIIAMVTRGDKRELVVECLANAMRAAKAEWVNDQTKAPPKHDPFQQESTDAA